MDYIPESYIESVVDSFDYDSNFFPLYIKFDDRVSVTQKYKFYDYNFYVGDDFYSSSGEVYLLAGSTGVHYPSSPYEAYRVNDYSYTDSWIVSLLTSPDSGFTGNYSEAYSKDLFGTCTYIAIDYNAYVNGTSPDSSTSNASNWYFVRIDSSTPPDYPIDNGVVGFLVDFGQTLISSSNSFFDLISFDIAGYNLLSLMFGSAFIIFVGWVIFKWVIPL